MAGGIMKDRISSDPNFEWKWIPPEQEQQEMSSPSQPVKQTSSPTPTGKSTGVQLPSDIEWREITPEQQEQEQDFSFETQSYKEPQQPESWPQTIARNVGSGLLKGVTSIPGTVAGLTNLVQRTLLPEQLVQPSQFTGTEEQYAQKTTKALGLPEDFTKPRNTAEKIGQGAISNLPLAALPTGLGTRLAARLTGSLAASIGSESAKALGAGPFGQIGAGFLGSALAGSNPASLVKKLPGLKNKAYDTADKLSSTIKVDAKPITKALLNLEQPAKDALKGPLYNRYYKQFLHDTDAISSKVKNGKIDLTDVVNFDKDINKMIFGKNVPEKVQEFFRKNVKSDFNKQLQTIAKDHPEWGQSYNAAKNMNTFIEGSKNFRHILDDSQVSSAFRDLTLPLGGWLIGTLVGGDLANLGKIGGGVIYGAKNLAKVYKNQGGYKGLTEIYSNPTTRKLAADMIQGAAENNKAAIISALKEMKKQEV